MIRLPKYSYLSLPLVLRKEIIIEKKAIWAILVVQCFSLYLVNLNGFPM